MKKTWTREYASWVKSIDMGRGHARDALDFYVQAVEEWPVSFFRTRMLET